MARRKIEVKSYRGRLTLADGFRIVAVLLAVAVVLSGGYYVYTEGGGELSFENPFAQLFATQVEEIPEPQPEPDPTPAPDPEPEPEPDPEPEPEPFTMLAVELSLEEALSPDLSANLATQGANAMVLDMKSDDGTLGFYTENPLIAAFPAVLDQTAEDTAALATLLEGDIYAVARISAFKDNIVGNDVDYAILSNSGYRWTDADKVHWACPTRQAMQDYLIQCIVETAELGFDEILLDNFGYPDRGELGWIRSWDYYDQSQLDVVMTALLADIAEVLEQYPDLTLSVRVPVEVLDGTDTRIGLTVEALDQYADLVWIDAQDESAYLAANFTLERAPVLVSQMLDEAVDVPQSVLANISF